MGKPLSLFGNYSGENAVTNYSGLIMRLLYEKSPTAFEELLNSVLPSSAGIKIGPSFQQQEKLSDSIPDLAIRQRAFSIFFETKLSNWFYTSQIKNHLHGISKEHELKILFLLSNFEEDDYDIQFEKSISQAEKDDIFLVPISFEDLIDQFDKVAPDIEFKNLIAEFSSYLDQKNLLPEWKYLLDVVNCASTMDEISDGAYMCPDSGGSYSHRRARYFGPYSSKAVRQINEIRALVSVGVDQKNPEIRWLNTTETSDSIIREAITHINKYNYRMNENSNIPLQVFLLGKPFPTKFRKDSKGGMFQSKKYFWGIARDCKGPEELADKLKDKYWKEFNK